MSKKDYVCKQLDDYARSTYILIGIYVLTTIVGLIRLSLKKQKIS